MPKEVALKDAYEKLAQVLGWQAQGKPPHPFKNIDVSWQELGKPTQTLVKTVGRMIFWVGKKLEEEVAEGNTKQVEYLKKHIAANDGGLAGPLGLIIKSFLLHKRNKKAVAAAVAESAPVSLIWGAAHAKGMGDELVKLGYERSHPPNLAPSGTVTRSMHTGGMAMRTITEHDRVEAVRRLSRTIKNVTLTESQVAAIEKATRQNSGTQYSAVLR